MRSPADADGMFDVLTYQKGGAVLRMLEQYLGADAFRSGVSHYLGEHAYGNTETSDLWDAIEETTGQPVRSLMDSWIWQPGYPLVNATLEGNELVLTQQRFAFGDTADSASWIVPVIVRNGGTTDRMLLEAGPAAFAPRRPGRARRRQCRRSRLLSRGVFDGVAGALVGSGAREPRHPGALQPRR